MSTKPEPDNSDFYRPSQAVAQEMRYSTDQLKARLRLTQGIIQNLALIRANLAVIRKEIARLDEMAQRNAAATAALKELAAMDNPPASPAPKESE